MSERIKTSWKNRFMLLGITAFTLIIFAIFIVVAEQLDYVQFYTGFTIANLSPMDTWLVLAIFPFGITFYIIFYFLYKLKFLELT